MWNIGIPNLTNGDWPIMFVALNGIILVGLALWALIAVVVGMPPEAKESVNLAPAAPADKQLDASIEG